MLTLNYFNSRQTGTIALTLSVGVFISACNSVDLSPGATNIPDNSPRVPISEAMLGTPLDCGEFKTYVTNSIVKTYTRISQYPYYSCAPIGDKPSPGVGAVVDGTTPPSSGVAAGGGNPAASPAKGPDGVSQTNNQEQGVNESDRVKVSAADGTMFIGHGNFLLIMKAFPPQKMPKLNEIDIGEQIINLFYDETKDHVIVMSRYREPVYILATKSPAVDAPSVGIVAPIPFDPITNVTIFDVTDRVKPILIEKISIDGSYSDSRRINNRLHLVTRNYKNPVKVYNDPEFVSLKSEFDTAVREVACADPASYDPAVVENDPLVIAAKNSLSTKVSTMVAAVDISAFIPTAKRGTAVSQTDIPQYLQCTDVHFPDSKSSLGMQVITSMDTDGANISATAIINNSWLTYVSQNNLYMAERSSYWWRDSPNIDQTAIHKFSISGGKPVYLATGLVDGYINNGFSMSEYLGVLRVASTQTDFENTDSDIGVGPGPVRWRAAVKNHLTLLNDDGNGNLNIISAIRNLAIGETIRSARFLKDRGFIVTFRNTDPLFTFDLSDPNNPVLKGELTIPGFSSYLHPYGNNHLLTVGREGGNNGTGLGNDVQLQLIDVTDMSQPVVVQKYTPNLPNGYSWSSAESDYLAFTYYADANLLAIPIQILPQSKDKLLPFSGVIAFKVSVESGFNEVAQVDHADLAKLFYCDGADKVAAPFVDYCSSGYYAAWAAPRRSVVMTSGPSVYLYTISDVGMKVGEIADPYISLGSMIFPPQVYPWYGGRIPINAGADVGVGSGGVGSGGVALP